MNVTYRIGVLALILMLAVMVGCNRDDSKTQVAEKKKQDHDHSSWWCSEHGIPEHDCAQCSAKVAAEYKKKGDWCKEHERPESQCFICHPELREKFADKYRAKYGKEPPPIEDEKAKKEEKKK